jgi:RNA polymerase sigma-70 factor (ECF subfamily)
MALGFAAARGILTGAVVLPKLNLLAGVRPGAGVSGAEPEGGESDRELVERCRGGEQAAFGALVERYQQRLVRFARGMVGNEEDARDVAQEAFVRAYTHLDRFDARRRFSVWLYSIASHVAVDWLRRRTRRQELDQRAPEPPGPPLPEEAALRTEAARLVQAAVGELPLGLRQLVLLHYGEGLSCAEAAIVMGISHGAARVRLFRAREQLRRQLGAHFAGAADEEVRS